MRTILSITLLIFSAGFLYGQDSLKTHRIPEIVVTGQYEPQSISRSVYQVRTITSERLMAKGATNLQDVLNTELNFRFSQDLALGTSSAAMNGLSGQYVKVLIDGIPMVGRQGTENDINLNQININTVERVEIVQGPMSVAYGSDAMAGVINIITKKAYENKFSLSAKVQEETVGKDYGLQQGLHNQNVSAGYSLKKFYGQLDIGRNDFRGWSGNAANLQPWYPKSQVMGAVVLGRKTEKLNVYYRLDAMDEVLKNYSGFAGGYAFHQKYISQRFMHSVQGELKITDDVRYNGAVAFTDYSRRTQSTYVDELTGKETLSLGAGEQDVTAFTGLTVRGTVHYKISDKFSVQPGYDVNVDDGSGGRLKEGSHTLRDYAAFASFEYTPAKFISIRPGVRFVSNSQFEAPPFIPAINTRFTLSERVDLRVSYGRGFRAPSLRELYFNFFDASHAIEGNPDLKPENSNSYNASLGWKSVLTERFTLTHTVSTFYNSIHQMINTGFLPGNTTVTTYLNIDHFKSQGVVLTNKIKYNALDAGIEFSYTGRYNDFEEDDTSLPSFVWSPEFNSTVSWRFVKPRLTANLFYKFTGPLPYYEVATVDSKQVVRLVQTNSYSWMDASLQKGLFKTLTLTFGVRNLFNVSSVNNSSSDTSGAHSTGGSRPIGYGRSYFVVLNFNLTR